MSDEAEEEAPEKSEEQPLGRRAILRRVVISTIVMFLVLEVVVRVIFFFHDRSRQAEVAARYPANTDIVDFAGVQDYRFVSLYTMNPEKGKGPEYDFDAHGFRLDRRKVRMEDPRAPGEKRIWMFGASTLQGAGNRADETIVARLNDRFEEAGSKWRVLNLGQGGYTTTTEVLLFLELLHAGYRPDAVVCYDGGSDVPFAGDVDRSGSPSWEKHGRKSGLMFDIASDGSISSILPLALSRMTKIDDFMIVLRNRMARGAAGAKKSDATDRGGQAYPDANWDVVAREYLLNHGVIQSMADMLHVPALHVFQPLMQYEDHYKLRKLGAEEEAFVGEMFANEWKRREAVFGDETRELRAALGEHLVDVHDVFRGHDGENVYADPRHPNGKGTAIIADRLFLELKKLVGDR